VSSYIICATPRSGSTLLCDLLNGTGVAGHPNSYYRRQGIPEWARAWGVSPPNVPGNEAFERTYLEAVRQAGTAQTGVFGLRLMWGTVAELSARLTTIYPGPLDAAARFERAFGKTLYVHLARQDKVAQAVSLLRAEQSGLWHRAADGTERERSAPPTPAIYDANRLAGFVEDLKADDAAWNGWFAAHGISALRLTYEYLASAPQAALADVLLALDLDPRIAATVNAKTRKLADETSLDWAERFRKESDDHVP